MNKTNSKFKLLILADDLTGALDSGVQLVAKGLNVLVYTHPCDIEEDQADVLVINTETRHVSSKQAYDIIYKLSKEAKEKGFTNFYKKTDSGLRGNIGSELEAILKGTMANHLNFIPAYPKMNRITKDGLHYVNGKLLSESIFACDPTNPIHTSSVKDIIALQSNVNDEIKIYDCESDVQLKQIANKLEADDDLMLCAGCAGFLEVYPINISNNTKKEEKVLNSELVVISGSANPITSKQLDEASKNGAIRYHLPIEEIINSNWDEEKKNNFIDKIFKDKQTHPILIDTYLEINKNLSKENSFDISKAVGSIACAIAKKYPNKMLMIIGGDALYNFINELVIKIVEPYKEICLGTVLAKYKYENVEKYMITKSGGFGDKDIIQTIVENLKGER